MSKREDYELKLKEAVANGDTEGALKAMSILATMNWRAACMYCISVFTDEAALRVELSRKPEDVDKYYDEYLKLCRAISAEHAEGAKKGIANMSTTDEGRRE